MDRFMQVSGIGYALHTMYASETTTQQTFSETHSPQFYAPPNFKHIVLTWTQGIYHLVHFRSFKHLFAKMCAKLLTC